MHTPSWNSACVPTTMAYLAATDRLQCAASRARRLRAGQQRNRDAERAKPARRNCARAARPAIRSAPSARPGGRRRQRARRPALRPRSCRSRRRPARSRTIGLVARQIRVHLGECAPLCARSVRMAATARSCSRERVGAAVQAQARSTRVFCRSSRSDEVMCQQLLEGQSPLRGMSTARQQRRARRRAAADARTRARLRSGDGSPRSALSSSSAGSQSRTPSRSSSRSACAISTRSRPCCTPSVAG